MTEDEEFEALEQRLNYKHKEQAMNREDIIQMAREAGVYSGANEVVFAASLERFAALVAAAAVEREREACAKVCEQEWNKYCVEPSGYALAVNECAAAIRARSKQ